MMLDPARRVHFVGVGGSGMSPLAEILLRRGYRVSGSDAAPSPVTDRLRDLGLAFSEGHAAGAVGDAGLVVRSSAIRPTNPELVEADRRNIPVVLRAEVLAELMRVRTAIAVAGAHGKTTTTAMVAVMLDQAGLDPTAVVGGRVPAFGSSARVGSPDLVVAEADESDRSFLLLTPTIAVVTNIDREHLEAYADLDDLERAFAAFVAKVPPHGRAVLCADDRRTRALSQGLSCAVTTYGLDATDADLVAERVVVHAHGASGVVTRRGPRGGSTRLGELSLRVPGRHNLLNALAATAVGLALDVPFDEIAAALASFAGAERRFERKGEARGVRVVDDYGHHPAEIGAVIAAARATGATRVLVAFQPHRYTRTARLMTEFGSALAAADAIVLTDIYAAGEDPLPGVTIEALARAVEEAAPGRVRLAKSLDEVPGVVAGLAQPGDLVVTLGAGSIAQAADGILEALRS